MKKFFLRVVEGMKRLLSRFLEGTPLNPYEDIIFAATNALASQLGQAGRIKTA